MSEISKIAGGPAPTPKTEALKLEPQTVETQAAAADPIPLARYEAALDRLEAKKHELVELDKSWLWLGRGWGDSEYAKDTASFLTGVLNQFELGTPFRNEFDGKIRDVQDLPYDKDRKNDPDRTSNGIYPVYDAAIDELRTKLGRPVQTEDEKP